MLKRKDWALFQGQDGSGSDSQSDSEGEQEAELSGSEDASASGQEGSSDGEGEEGGMRRLEDLSEDDFESDGDGVDVEAAALKEQWLAATKEETSKLPRAALSCRLCKGVLMLGPASLRQHLDSKKHLARLKRKAEGFEPVFLAMGAQDDSDQETHQERLARIKVAAAAPAEGQQSRKKKSSKAKKAKELKEGGILKRAGKGKPGKRQRAELKAAAENGGSRKGKARLPRRSGDGKSSEPAKETAVAGTSAPAGKSSFWSSPPKKGDQAGDMGKGGIIKLKGRGKGKEDGMGAAKGGVKKYKGRGKGKVDEGSSANRAERRRVKQERLKGVKKGAGVVSA